MRRDVGQRPRTYPLDGLFCPSSVAIVGASERNYYAENAYRRLQRIGYRGEVTLVNPARSEVYGAPAVASLRDAPRPVDLAFIAVPSHAVPDVIEDCAHAGTRAAVVVSTGFAERDDAGAALQERLVGRARELGIAVCGPACLGVMSPHDGFEAFGGNMRTVAEPGHLAVVSQSGANVHALVASGAGRGIGFSRVVSSGIGAVLEVADYLEYLIEDPNTRAIALIVEQLPSPLRFRAAAIRALDQGKAIGVILVGRSDAGQRAVIGHTGAITGRGEFYDELFRDAGVVTARSVDELIDRLALFVRVPRSLWPRGGRLGILSVSGGTAAMFCDVAAAEGLVADELSSSTAARVAQNLPDGHRVANPLDLTADIERRHGDRWPQIVGAMLTDEAIDAVVAIPGTGQRAERMRSFGAVQRQLGKAVVLCASSRATETFADGDASAVAAEHNVADLGDLTATARALAAAAGLAAARSRRRSVADPPAPVEPPADPVLTEYAARRLLSSFGIRGPDEAIVRTPEEAAAAAGDIGFPVVAKALNPEFLHRSEHGLVALDLRTGHAVSNATDHILAAQAGTADPAVLIQKMATGVEVLVAAITEPGFPPLVVVGAGGELVELGDDRAARFAPLASEDVHEMLAELRLGRLLAGYRSRGAADVDALVEAVVGFSRFAAAAADWLEEAELNPLAVGPAGQGALALDALISPRAGV